ncbi:unnamed protein product, partial [Ectocarpus sp. 12 AP-2014]
APRPSACLTVILGLLPPSPSSSSSAIPPLVPGVDDGEVSPPPPPPRSSCWSLCCCDPDGIVALKPVVAEVDGNDDESEEDLPRSPAERRSTSAAPRRPAAKTNTKVRRLTRFTVRHRPHPTLLI